jgi:hypothetical protein
MKVESLTLDPRICTTLTLSTSNLTLSLGKLLMHALAINLLKKSPCCGNLAETVALNPLATCS